MKVNELRKIVKEEILNILHENENDAPKSRSAKDIAEFIKGDISPDSDEDDIIHLIFSAVTKWAQEQKRLGYYKNGKVSTIVFNIAQYDEDYIPDVLDALIEMGVKYDRLGVLRKKNPKEYERLQKDSPDFIKKFS